MKWPHMLAAAALLALAATPGSAESLPMDRPIVIDGIATVCTGIGQAEQTDLRWKAYPIRVEFANSGMQYLAGAHVELKDAHGRTLVTLDCAGAWVLFQLPAGQYTVTATLPDYPDEPARGASFSPPATGQKRVVLEFPGIKPNQ